ncbi:hypothetical protein FF1_046592 [Malus domestica]
MELSFVQPFVIFSLCSGALWANVFQDILVMYDKHLLMLYSTYDQHLRLDGWHCLFTFSVFLWFGFFIEKLVRNEDEPPHKLLYKENGKKRSTMNCCAAAAVPSVGFSKGARSKDGDRGSLRSGLCGLRLPGQSSIRLQNEGGRRFESILVTA